MCCWEGLCSGRGSHGEGSEVLADLSEKSGGEALATCRQQKGDKENKPSDKRALPMPSRSLPGCTCECTHLPAADAPSMSLPALEQTHFLYGQTMDSEQSHTLLLFLPLSTNHPTAASPLPLLLIHSRLHPLLPATSLPPPPHALPKKPCAFHAADTSCTANSRVIVVLNGRGEGAP